MNRHATASEAAAELVFLHGWGMNAAVWRHWLADFSPEVRLRSLELPGHGHSPWDPAWTTLGDWAEACLEAAPERAVWVGWSLGGLVALEAALRAPRRVAGLVQLTATPRFVRAADWPAAMEAATLARFHAELRADPAATLPRFLALQVRGGEAAHATLRRLRRELAGSPAPVDGALNIGLALLRDSDLRARLRHLSCPSLWLFGRHDTLVPGDTAAALAALLPEARWHVIPGAAHAPWLSHPGETEAEMRSFLQDIQS